MLRCRRGVGISLGFNAPPETMLGSLHPCRADAHLQMCGAGVHVVSGRFVAETQAWDMFTGIL